MIPLVDLRAQYDEVKSEIQKGWEETLRSMNLYLGPNVRGFEKDFSNYIGIKYCFGVDSGTDALFIALKSLGIGEGDEVILPSLTFFASPEAVVLAGAKPVFVDVNEFYTINPDEIESCITKKTKAIIPVHLYGVPSDMNPIIEIAERKGLSVIEDSAQAHGAEYFDGKEWKKVGSFGDASAFSFYLSKNLSALGEGGCVLTNREDIKEKLDIMRYHGQITKYEHKLIGMNSRLDELQAVVLRIKLRKLDKWNEKRVEIAEKYNEMLKDTPVHLPEIPDYAHPVWHLYVIRTEKRDELMKYLKDNGIGVGIHYPIPCHKQPGLSGIIDETRLPNTEKFAKEVLSLPVYPQMTDDNIEFVAEKIKNFFRR